MLQIAADPPSPPVIACFPGLESNNFNGLVLICFCFTRATYASASPTVAGYACLHVSPYARLRRQASIIASHHPFTLLSSNS
jgi:hypothetical protein